MSANVPNPTENELKRIVLDTLKASLLAAALETATFVYVFTASRDRRDKEAMTVFKSGKSRTPPLQSRSSPSSPLRDLSSSEIKDLKPQIFDIFGFDRTPPMPSTRPTWKAFATRPWPGWRRWSTSTSGSTRRGPGRRSAGTTRRGGPPWTASSTRAAASSALSSPRSLSPPTSSGTSTTKRSAPRSGAPAPSEVAESSGGGSVLMGGAVARMQCEQQGVGGGRGSLARE